MEKTTLTVNDFNLKYSFESGQPLSFYADFLNNELAYTAKNHIVNIKQENNKIILKSDDIIFAKKELISRFRLKDPMKTIYNEISTDSFMAESISRYKGLHITLNDPWETLVVFIISQNNNIRNIRNSVLKLIELFGTETEFKTKNFPALNDLLNAKENDFKKCSVGFRAKYLKNAVDYCTNNLDLYKLKQKDYETIVQELLQVNGVGNKIADCVALMGYGKLEAFPIDIWIKRILEKIYFKGNKTDIKILKSFAMQKWEKYAGYAQQYLYWNARNNFNSY
ncbi:MAG: hypothetical protein M1168_02005 [Candidatus Marsarchaeota archaeon]|nr:hypothetical protein [Candidatus Marsarchaeota archaeon]MCL5094734.1 hypothetical protein [Candidatus Marsarchaeota archaeon]